MASLTSKMGSQSVRKTCNSCFKRFSVTPAKTSAFCKSCVFQVMDDFVGQAKEGTFFASEDKDEDESDFQSILCDMCDKNQFAAYHCRKCRCKLCCHCHNSHDTRQCSVTVSSSDTKSGRSSVDLQELRSKGKDQMKDMRQILDTHDQNLAEIKSHQKQLLVQMTDIHLERSAVQSKYDALKQGLMCDDPSPAVLISSFVTDEKMASMQEKTAVEIFKYIPPFSRAQEAFRSIPHSEFECILEESCDSYLSPAIASTGLTSESGSLQNLQVKDRLSRLEECIEELKKCYETIFATEIWAIKDTLEKISAFILPVENAVEHAEFTKHQRIFKEGSNYKASLPINNSRFSSTQREQVKYKGSDNKINLPSKKTISLTETKKDSDKLFTRDNPRTIAQKARKIKSLKSNSNKLPTSRVPIRVRPLDSMTAISITHQDISVENSDSPISSPTVGDPKGKEYKDVEVSTTEFPLLSPDNERQSIASNDVMDVTIVDKTNIESEIFFLDDRKTVAERNSYPPLPQWPQAKICIKGFRPSFNDFVSHRRSWHGMEQQVRKLQQDATNELLKKKEGNS